MAKKESLQQLLEELNSKKFSPLDFLGRGSLNERIVSLALGETVAPLPGDSSGWQQLKDSLSTIDTDELTVVVFGGGTGLSNIIGGDSRRPEWPENPFNGLKELFTNLYSIVCVTDDGGSTGEMLKDLPLVALGDLRHVLLSSIRSSELDKRYELSDQDALLTARELHILFNYRFSAPPQSAEQLWEKSGICAHLLPDELSQYLRSLTGWLFTDKRLCHTLQRPHCLGNLLIAAAIYNRLPSFFTTAELLANQKRVQGATLEGLAALSQMIGAGEQSVLPCSTITAELQMVYANGVQVTGEKKSSQAKRGFPVERVLVQFTEEPFLPEPVAELISKADIIIMAPGSLYSSIIPILQTPGLADRIRQNHDALKLLISNIWVQKGETDATLGAPERKFHVSDLILAYDQNISGGIYDLFSHVLTLDLADISGAVLQNYAIEDKEPIYSDSDRIRELGLEPVQSCIYSGDLLKRRNVIQHDPAALARAVQVLWGLRCTGHLVSIPASQTPAPSAYFSAGVSSDHLLPCLRYQHNNRKLDQIRINSLDPISGKMEDMAREEQEQFRTALSAITWNHPDIHPHHLDYIQGISLIDAEHWKRCQQWDNVFSFYDPDDSCIKIRSDQAAGYKTLAMAFLVGLGQSLLGNYCLRKGMEDISYQGRLSGRIYCLEVRKEKDTLSFFTARELDSYLKLSRMIPSKLADQELTYTRLVNGKEGFTPPGLLFGLLFAWYLDNRFAPNIDYKMSIMKNEPSRLIPEQVRIVHRRTDLIDFIRTKVFSLRLPR